MTKKQIVWSIVVLLIVLVLVAAARRSGNRMMTSTDTTTKTTANQVVVPTPETIDAITDSIALQGAEDSSAMDAETAAALQDIDADSESINNLGTSYDENSF
ncbi:MAG: hypothetical protein KBD27_01750 [Candidatus Moranbacteria bacterium]|nr:hypothetical protein [Candidatus Moranbacteria bacterium]